MLRRGRRLAWGVLLIVLALGCKAPRPELKPVAEPEVLTVPPKEARFNRSVYPDVAFRDMDHRFAKPNEGVGLGSGLGSGMTPARALSSPGSMSPVGMNGLR